MFRWLTELFYNSRLIDYFIIGNFNMFLWLTELFYNFRIMDYVMIIDNFNMFR